MKNKISVKEAASRLGVSVCYIRCAIEQGTFPGSYVKHNDRTSYHIPLTAFNQYCEGIYKKEGNEEK